MLTKELKKRKLTQERLKELLHYDANTGIWTWRIDGHGRVKKGDMAGSIDKDGYRLVYIDYRRYRSSRLAFLYMVGYFPEHEAEHRNRIRDDDRWFNLREATRMCNCRNRGLSKLNKSGVTGVSFARHANKFYACIRANSKNINLGYFKDKKDAAIARWEAEKKYDFPDCNSSSSAFLYLKKRNLI